MPTPWNPARAVPKPEGKKKGGTSPKAKGDREERAVGKLLGEKRTVGSGAFKNTNKNLEGDMDIRDAKGKEFIKLEIKYSGDVTASGEKTYTMKEDVIKQMINEATTAGELGALVFRYKHGERYVLMSFDHWHKLVELARLGNVGGSIDVDNNLSPSRRQSKAS